MIDRVNNRLQQMKREVANGRLDSLHHGVVDMLEMKVANRLEWTPSYYLGVLSVACKNAGEILENYYVQENKFKADEKVLEWLRKGEKNGEG